MEISRNHGPNDGVDAGEHSMEGGEDVAFDEAEDDFDMATNEFD